LLIILDGIQIPDNFHVSLADIAENPTCIEMVLREFLKLLNGLKTIVHDEVVVAFS